MIDWNQLRADDPGYPGDTVSVTDAHATLAAMTVTRELPINRIDQRDIYNALGAANGEIVLSAIDAASLDSNNPFQSAFVRVADWIKPGADMGIDICDPEVQAALNTLVGGAVTQLMIDDVIALKNETVIKYPGLRVGDVIKARAAA